jgi:hypothetical protein
MKTSNGVPPRRVQVPGPIASLNDGPQASLIKTLDGFANATGARQDGRCYDRRNSGCRK